MNNQLQTQPNSQPERPQKPRKPKLTRKQRVFVDEYVKTGNGTEAAKKAYDVDPNAKSNVAAAIASEILTYPNVVEGVEVAQQSLKKALIEGGITPKVIATKVKVLLDAQDRLGGTDYTAVDKGLKHATNIFGVEDVSQPKSVNMYNFFFNKELRQKVDVVEDEIKLALTKDAQKT